MLIAAAGAVGVRLHMRQVQRATEARVEAAEKLEVPARIAWDVTLEELAGTFQGTLSTGESSSWLVLQVDHPHLAEDVVYFHYTINSSTRRRSGNGAASLIGRWIDLGTLKGQIVRNDKGALMFRSMPRNTKPEWVLEASR